MLKLVSTWFLSILNDKIVIKHTGIYIVPHIHTKTLVRKLNWGLAPGLGLYWASYVLKGPVNSVGNSTGPLSRRLWDPGGWGGPPYKSDGGAHRKF